MDNKKTASLAGFRQVRRDRKVCVSADRLMAFRIRSNLIHSIIYLFMSVKRRLDVQQLIKKGSLFFLSL